MPSGTIQSLVPEAPSANEAGCSAAIATDPKKASSHQRQWYTPDPILERRRTVCERASLALIFLQALNFTFPQSVVAAAVFWGAAAFCVVAILRLCWAEWRHEKAR